MISFSENRLGVINDKHLSFTGINEVLKSYIWNSSSSFVFFSVFKGKVYVVLRCSIIYKKIIR